MKRSIVATAAASLILSLTGLAGCSGEPQAAAGPTAETSGWVTPPMVDSVVRNGASLLVRGRAAPLGRVVLRSAATAYAVGADDEGRFELRIAAPPTDTLFVVEAQTGEDAAPAPYRMLVSRDPAGPVALLAAGAASRRLDPAPALDVIDSDGRVLAVSGRTTPGRRVAVSIPGAAPVAAVADATGRWTVMLDAVDGGAATVTVAGSAFAYPGSAPAAPGAAGTLVVRAGEGWRINWSIGSRARQSSWFPDRRAPRP